jgi:hypothetical protein
MANATITTTTLSGTITTAIFLNALRDGLISVGYTLFDSYVSGSNDIRVLALNSSAETKGTVYLQITANNTLSTIAHQLHETWNTTTKAGTGSSVSVGQPSFTTGTTAINFCFINHPEFKGVIIEQNTAQFVIGILRPKQSPPSWWNENSFAYAFQAKYSTVPTSSRLGSTTTPFGNAIDHEYLQSTKLQDGNAQNSNARSILPLCILSAGVGGVIASCDDVVVCSSSTMRPLDTITVSPTEVYTYIWGNSLTSGIAIRTT